MAKETLNYGFSKPYQDDFYDVGVSNGNMDKIDSALMTKLNKSEVNTVNGVAGLDALGKVAVDKLPEATTTKNGVVKLSNTLDGSSTNAITSAAVTNAINKMGQTKVISIGTGWSSTAPYTQTITVSGITAQSTPVISLYVPSTAATADVKAWTKAFACVDDAESGSGTIKFTCYNKKPAVVFQVHAKGV